MLHNIYKENAVNWVLKWRLTSVGPFSRNKSHYVPALQIIILHLPVKMILKIQNTLVISDCNWTWTHNHLVRKQTLNHLDKLAIFIFF